MNTKVDPRYLEMVQERNNLDDQELGLSGVSASGSPHAAGQLPLTASYPIAEDRQSQELMN